jgi:cell division protein FtsI (penicillin-binding protein 3)
MPRGLGADHHDDRGYGHGIAVTPLHLACAYAALVNGGIWRPATLFKVDPARVPPGRRVFKASTSARIRQLLRMIVVEAPAARPMPRLPCRRQDRHGRAWRGRLSRTRLVATFAAFPMDKPRYVVIATLDEPQGNAATSGQRTAAWNAAPIVGRVVPHRAAAGRDAR